jgi:hypothetical protein
MENHKRNVFGILSKSYQASAVLDPAAVQLLQNL